MVLQAPIGFAILLNETKKAEENKDWHLFPIYKGLRIIFPRVITWSQNKI